MVRETMTGGDAGEEGGGHLLRGLACLINEFGFWSRLPGCKKQKSMFADFIRKLIYLENIW